MHLSSASARTQEISVRVRLPKTQEQWVKPSCSSHECSRIHVFVMFMCVLLGPYPRIRDTLFSFLFLISANVAYVPSRIPMVCCSMKEYAPSQLLNVCVEHGSAIVAFHVFIFCLFFLLACQDDCTIIAYRLICNSMLTPLGQ
jgi:hypothetical protein